MTRVDTIITITGIVLIGTETRDTIGVNTMSEVNTASTNVKEVNTTKAVNATSVIKILERYWTPKMAVNDSP